MSLNWVMLDRSGSGFVPLPGETTIYSAPQRSSFRLRTVGKLAGSESSMFPGHAPTTDRPPKLDASSGRLILTSHRVLYLPDSPESARFRSFAAPLGNIRDAHLVQPWFGPNQWCSVVLPVPDGGLPNVPLELTVTFKDGGAFEFDESFVRIRERMNDGINHIDDLPSYAPAYAATPAAAAPAAAPTPAPVHPTASDADDLPPPPYESALSG
ncbi:hypothetical protein BZA70DRAFT_277512 [Myxozyma melibiosi]|uniref:GRAM domain-containing protein n=1 Tax=Myxozyma melibiosi TaxID=54550 RepID=A0ABR1F867_9ASCO